MSDYTYEYTTPEKTSIIFTHATQPQFKINVGDNYIFTYRRGADIHVKVTRIEPDSNNITKPGNIYYKKILRGISLPFSGEGVTYEPAFSEVEGYISVSKIAGLKDDKIRISGGGVSNRSKRSKKTKSKRGGRCSRCRSIKKYRKVRKSRRRRYMRS